MDRKPGDPRDPGRQKVPDQSSIINLLSQEPIAAEEELMEKQPSVFCREPERREAKATNGLADGTNRLS